MPVDREIHFGYPTAEKAFAFAKRLGIDITGGPDEGPVDYDTFMGYTEDYGYDFDIGDLFKTQLRKSFIKTCDDLGWETGKIAEPKIYAKTDRYIGVHSPWGPRIASIWSLYSIYDQVELGDEKANFSIAVNLSSRYTPHIMDMDNSGGGLDNSIVFNQEFFDKIELCKRNLIAAIPELHDAEIFIRNVFY